MKFLMVFTQKWDINMKNKFFKHLGMVTKHRYMVFKLCAKCGFVWRGLVHDLSKFSPVEFFEGVKYYTGVGSPIANCRKHNGYSLHGFIIQVGINIILFTGMTEETKFKWICLLNML